MANDRVPSPEEFFGGKPAVRGEDAPKEDLVFENDLGVSADPQVIDVFDSPAENAVLADPVLMASITEAAGMMDAVELAELADALALMSPDDAAAHLRELHSQWESIKSDPVMAKALIDRIDAFREQEPGKSYWAGKSSEAMKDAVWRARQIVNGEVPVPRERHPLKDGNSY